MKTLWNDRCRCAIHRSRRFMVAAIALATIFSALMLGGVVWSVDHCTVCPGHSVSQGVK